MRLVDLADDLIFEIAFYLDVFAARSLSQTCSRIFRLSQYESAYWFTVLVNHQKFEPARLLPLPPYYDVRKFSSSQLRDLVDYMIQLEKNLSRERPTHRQPPIECKIQYRPTSFDIIPGTPLIIFRSSSTTRVFCFDYEQRSVICEVVDIFSLTPISPLYHEYGKCTQVLRRQPLFQLGAEASLSLLQLEYHFDSKLGRWGADMSIHTIGIPRPVAGENFEMHRLGSSLAFTDGEIVGYCGIDFGGGTMVEAQLKIIVLNVKTNKFTRISTGIMLHADDQAPDFLLVTRDRDLFVSLDDRRSTHIWRIPYSFLPYENQPSELDILYPLTPENDIGHCYEKFGDVYVADYTTPPHLHRNTTEKRFRTLFFMSHSPHPSVQATFNHYEARMGDKRHQTFSYRRWYIPHLDGSGSIVRVGASGNLSQPLLEMELEEGAPEINWELEAPGVFPSIASCFYPPQDSEDELMIMRYYESPPRMVPHILEMPAELEGQLLLVSYLAFDEALGVATLILDDGTLYVLKFGPRMAFLG